MFETVKPGAVLHLVENIGEFNLYGLLAVRLNIVLEAAQLLYPTRSHRFLTDDTLMVQFAYHQCEFSP